MPVAEAGALNVLAAGPDEFLDRAQPFFDVIGTRTWRLGRRPEQATIVKILGNYLIACVLQSVGEAVSLAEALGVDAGRFVDLLGSTLFPGPVYSSYGELIAARCYQPANFRTVLGRRICIWLSTPLPPRMFHFPLASCCAQSSTRRWPPGTHRTTGHPSPSVSPEESGADARR